MRAFSLDRKLPASPPAETGELATAQSIQDSNLNGDSAGDRTVINPSGDPSLGSNVKALTNSKGDTVGYLALNPNGRLPAIDDDGFVLWESLAITLYLAKKYSLGRLYPATLEGEAKTWQWSLWAVQEADRLGHAGGDGLGLVQAGHQDGQLERARPRLAGGYPPTLVPHRHRSAR